jgi:hypothetical protein
MIEPHTAEIWAALLGLIGALLLAIPFIDDYFAKRDRLKKLENLQSGIFTQDDADALRQPAERVALEKILKADITMALCSGAGCVALVASFVVLLLKRG